MIQLGASTISDSYERIIRYFQWNIYKENVISNVITEDGKSAWQSIPLDVIIYDPTNKLDNNWIHKNSPYGKQFYDEYIKEIVDGKNAGKFDYDYHSRLFHYDNPNNEADQVQYIIDKLNDKPTSRRAMAITWNPFIDKDVMNVPCLQFVQFWIVNNKLNMYVLFRSEDMAMGYPVNVVGLVSLMLYVSEKTGIKCGTYHHSVVIPHIYHTDESIFNKWK